MFAVGQCIIGQLTFKDGSPSFYWRPYLVVDVNTMLREIKILNISSVAGKELKLHFPTNVPLLTSIPPLSKPSFVKVDSLQTICFNRASGCALLSNGIPISKNDFENVLEKLKNQT